LINTGVFNEEKTTVPAPHGRIFLRLVQESRSIQTIEKSDPDPVPADSIYQICDNCIDSDGDTVPNWSDNCPDDANPDQADSDDDGVGDVCDDDGDA